MSLRPNPVVAGLHPDPSICRVGDDYYLACSSFEYFPAVPILHSTDLSTWSQVGNAFDRPGQVDLAGVSSSGGVFAPTLRHHDDQFWLTTTVVGAGHVVATAPDAAGPWSDPVAVALPGIDPDLAWDDEGTCWFTYTVDGQIMQAPIDPHTGKVLREPAPLWSGTGLAFPEAPHLYHIGDHWYLLIAEGGTERGHAVSVARGPAPDGPFTGCPHNPVLSHRSTDRPVQNTGHADLVQAVDGSWWMVLLGVRPRGGSPAFHVLGRETFLTPVRWVDGWPVPDPVTIERPPAPTTYRDSFDATTLAPEWISVRRRPAEAWSVSERPGSLILRGADATLDQPDVVFVGRRQQHPGCWVRAAVDASAGSGGLAVRIDERHHYEIETDGEQVWCSARIGPLTSRLGARAVGRGPVVLTVDIEPSAASFGTLCAPPDRIRLGVDVGGAVEVLADLDGRYLSTEVAGGFTGRVVGMYATTGAVAFDWFQYQGS